MISSWGRANICVDFRTVFWHKCEYSHSAWERMKQAMQVDLRDGVGRAALLRRVALSAGLTLLAVAALAAIFAISRGIAVERVRESAQATLGSRVQAIESVLEKQRAVATVLASDELVRRAVADPDSHHREVSRKLERLQQETRSAVIYLVDAGGWPSRPRTGTSRTVSSAMTMAFATISPRRCGRARPRNSRLAPSATGPGFICPMMCSLWAVTRRQG